MTNTLQVYKN